MNYDMAELIHLIKLFSNRNSADNSIELSQIKIDVEKNTTNIVELQTQLLNLNKTIISKLDEINGEEI